LFASTPIPTIAEVENSLAGGRGEMRDISSGRGDKGKEGYKFLLRGETLRCGEYEFPFKELLLIDSDR
jgi:hypothetical protein